jgi:hypothetical protein
MKRPNRATEFLQDVEIVQLGDQERGVGVVGVLLISFYISYSGHGRDARCHCSSL